MNTFHSEASRPGAPAVSYPTCRKPGVEFTISIDEDLREQVFLSSPDFPITMYTQSYSHEAADRIPFHWHDELQVVWVSQGALAYCIGGDTLSLDTSKILFINSRRLHSSRPPQQDTKSLCINFAPEVFHPMLLSHYIAPLLEHPDFSYALLPLPPYQISRLEQLLLCEQNDLEYFSIMNFLSQILEDITKDFKVGGAPLNQEELHQFHAILDYVHQNYSQPLTIAQIAGQSLINKNQLTLLFHKYTNMPPIKYLNEYRLYQARNQIVRTSLSISEISEAVGYNQVSHFIKQFRDSYGVSPLKYRKRFGKNKSVPQESLSSYDHRYSTSPPFSS